MEESTEINDEDSCKEKDIGILKTRAKEYEKDLNQVCLPQCLNERRIL